MRDQAVSVKEHAPSFEISFTYGEPAIAQAVVRELVTKAVEGNIREQRNHALAEGGQYKLMVEYKIGELLEVLDPASLPVAPVAPNRTVIAGLGFGAGLLLGAVTLALRRPRHSSMVRAVPAAAG
jgi:LPS O-antigen subunit length determinant protein (WzzB/FepE family)